MFLKRSCSLRKVSQCPPFVHFVRKIFSPPPPPPLLLCQRHGRETRTKLAKRMHPRLRNASIKCASCARPSSAHQQVGEELAIVGATLVNCSIIARQEGNANTRTRNSWAARKQCAANSIVLCVALARARVACADLGPHSDAANCTVSLPLSAGHLGRPKPAPKLRALNKQQIQIDSCRLRTFDEAQFE